MQVLEIRVHGVSNTPPQSVLLATSEQDVSRVAGDEVTGFYERNDQDPIAFVQTQAYSWGQLTAGVRAKKDLYRALWMLLLPLALVNVAFWSRTRFPEQTERARTDGLTSYLARILAASMTVTLVLAAAGVGVDLVGWQWQHAAGQGVKKLHWLEFLYTSPTFSTGGRPLALGLLAPATVLLVVWLTARRSFTYESEIPTLRGDEQSPTTGLHMSGRNFWRGDEQVKRLASVHVAFGAVACCAVAAGPALYAHLRDDPWSGRLPSVVLAVMGITTLGALCILALPVITERGGSGAGHLTAWLSPAALVLFLLTGSYLAVVDFSDRSAKRLPGFDATIRTMFFCQLMTLLALGVSIRWSQSWARLGVAVTAGLTLVGAVVSVRGPTWLTQHWPLRWLPDELSSPDGRATALIVGVILLVASVLSLWPGQVAHNVSASGQALYGVDGPGYLNKPAWRGAGAVLLAGMGLLLAALYSAGVLFYLADWLNGDGVPIGGDDLHVSLPLPLEWAAVGLVPFAALLGLAALVQYGVLGWSARRGCAAVVDDYGADSEHELARAVTVARARAFHDFMGDRLLAVVGFFAAAIALPLVAAATAAAATGLRAEDLLHGHMLAAVVFLRTTGTRLSILLLAGIVLAGGLVYRAKPERRGIGVIWDLVTFWPRACHPFAPPCYAERCVPQLVTRIAGDDAADGFVLAGHSQGAVLSLATLLQLPSERRARVYLLTFGTQLHRLYGRAFPAFFGPAALRGVALLMQQDEGEPERRWLRWRSLYRPTDPLGYPVDVTLGSGQGTKPPAGDLCVDHPGRTPHHAIADPHALHPPPAEILDPPIRKHSDYPADPVFAAVRDDAADRLTGRVPMSQAGPSRAVPAAPEEGSG
jgi:hypothetical protein